MSKKNIFNKLTIMITLIFSFFLSIFPSNLVNAEVNQNVVYYKVGIDNVSYRNNTIYFKLKEVRDIIAIQYEYAYLDDEGVKVSLLATCDTFNKMSNVDFSFVNSTGKELVGVKIWTIQFVDSDTYHPIWLTDGSNEWMKSGTTGINGAQRLKTLEVTKNKLTYNNASFDDYGLDDFFKFSGYKKEYTGILFFSLDNEEQDLIIDSIYRIEVNLVTYENTWSWWGASKKYNQNRTTHRVEIYEDYTTPTKRVNGVLVEDTPMIGSGLNNEGYDWYVLFNNQLKDTSGNVIDLSASSSFAGYSGSQTYLDEVAVMNLTYVYDGEFFDVEVLDKGTGYTVYTKVDLPWYDKVFDWMSNHIWVLILLLVVILIGFCSPIIFIIIKGIGYLLKGLWIVIKYTIGLPFVLLNKKNKEEEKSKNRLDKQVNSYRRYDKNFKNYTRY